MHPYRGVNGEGIKTIVFFRTKPVTPPFQYIGLKILTIFMPPLNFKPDWLFMKNPYFVIREN